MSAARAALLLGAALLVLLEPLAATSSAADTCESCHGSSGGYSFRPLAVSSTTPRMVAPGGNFSHVVQLAHPGRYTCRGATVTVDLSGAPGITLVGSPTVSLAAFSSGLRTASFALAAGSSEVPQTISTTVRYVAEEHGASATYVRTSSITLTIGEALLSPSSWRVDIRPGDVQDLTFTASRALRNFTVLASPALAAAVNVSGVVPASLIPGGSFMVSLSGVGTGAGLVTVVYEEASGAPHTLPVDVSVAVRPTRVAPSGDVARMFGAALGFGSLGLLVLSAVIGMPFRPLKRRVNKAFASGQVRSAFHCGVSWVLIALALLHAAMLMYTNWSSSMVGGIFLLAEPGSNLGTTIDMGTVGWFAMLFTGAGGVLAKPITAWIGHAGWRYSHSLMTLTALLASVFHSVVFTVRLV